MDSEYIIKVNYLNGIEYTNKELYVPRDEGHIEFEYMRNKKGNVKVKWGPLQTYSPGTSINTPIDNVRYKLVFSNNSRAVLDSACAIKRSSNVYTIYESSNNDT
jgi:hypothetical protein